MSSFDDQLLLIKSSIYANRKDADEKMKKYDSKLDNLISMVKNMMYQDQNSSLEKVESPKSQVMKHPI